MVDKLEAKLPVYKFEELRPTNLPRGCYLAKVVKVEKYIANKSGRPCLKWLWWILDGKYKWRSIVTFTGDGSDTSHPYMNESLKKYLAAFGFRFKKGFSLRKLKGKQATIYTEQGKYNLCDVNKGIRIIFPKIIAIKPADNFKKYAKEE